MFMFRLALRFDDVCPTMKWSIWDQIESRLDRHSVQPILGVVPDNQDPKLVVDSPNPEFWQRARAWQKKGWIIGLHGYRHVYDSKSKGLVPWWPQSEFAGLPRSTQQQRISRGVEILRENQVEPRVWIAPAHSFDENTLAALQTAGLSIISDGWGYRPYRCHRGMSWIPAQPWRPRFWQWGSWTEVVHSNGLKDPSPIDHLIQIHKGVLMGVGFTFVDLLKVEPKTLWDSAFERLYGALFGLVRLPQQHRRRVRFQKAGLSASRVG